MKKTKVVCTIGPASSDVKMLKEMIERGMDVARLNMSHGNHESHQTVVDMIKALREKLDKPVAILVDTKGPEIRIKQFDGGSVCLERGKMFSLTTSDVVGNDRMVSVTYSKLPQILKMNDTILLSDGSIELKVISVTKYDVLTRVIEGGELSNNKSLNLPGIEVDMPYMSPADKKDILFAIENDVEYIAISFVRSADDVKMVRKFIEENKGSKIKIISKIENKQGIDNIDEIIKHSDGVMVARGDLGVEVDFKKIPIYQKEIIRNCTLQGKISITATQMLESMICSSRPTRAEISDVANAVLDGSSAVMLSGETAIGKYVTKSIKTMCDIIEECEENFASKINTKDLKIDIDDVTESIAYACTALSYNSPVKAIIALTLSGKSASDISVFKPNCPVIACACDKKVFNQLAMNWGVIPVHVDFYKNSIDDLIEAAKREVLKQNIASKNDIVVFTASLPFGKSKVTNLLKVEVL